MTLVVNVLSWQKKNMDYEARVTRNGVSANHLLNFSLPEREKSVHSHYKKKKKQSSVPRTQTEYLHAKYVCYMSLLLHQSPHGMDFCDLYLLMWYAM